MEKKEIVKNLITAIEQCKFDEANQYLSDDFTFTGPTPKPLGKKEWLDLHKKMNKGIPDFKFNLKQLNESGNVVNGSVKITGTQSKEMPSLMQGMPGIPPTNKRIELPEENVTATFKGDKVANITVEKVPNGGITGLLKQLGVAIPEKL